MSTMTREQMQMAHVVHTWTMLTALPACTEDQDLPGIVQVACLESYFVNLRLLIEFLGAQPGKPSSKDFDATDFLPTWQHRLDKERWERMWNLASKHVVHFSLARVPTSGPVEEENVCRAKLEIYAGWISDELVRLGEEMLAAGKQLGRSLTV